MANKANKMTRIEAGKYTCNDILFERVDYTCDGGGIQWVAAEYIIDSEGNVIGTTALDSFSTLADAKYYMISK
jgi:hypothetical protein